MSTFVVKRLQSLQPGAWVKITYESGETFEGEISMTDNETGFELVSPTAGLTAVDFEMVKVFSLPPRAQASAVPVQVPEVAPTPVSVPEAAPTPVSVPAQPTAPPTPVAVPDAPVMASPAASERSVPAAPAPTTQIVMPEGVIARANKSVQPPFYMQEIESFSSSDFYIKTRFDALPSAVRKAFEGKYRSFEYGVSHGDKDKVRRAAHEVRQQILNDSELAQEKQAGAFCALMLARCTLISPEIYLSVGGYAQAALELYLSGNLNLLSAAYAAVALQQNQENSLTDPLFTMLTEYCKKEADISLVYWVAEHAVDTQREPLGAFAEFMLAQQGFAPNSPVLKKQYDALLQVYPCVQAVQNEAVAALLAEVCPSPQLLPGATPVYTVAQPQEQAQASAVHEGEISSLRWSVQRGEITSNGEKYAFAWSDIVDKGLYQRISVMQTSAVKPADAPVYFALQGDTAVQVKPRVLQQKNTVSSDTAHMPVHLIGVSKGERVVAEIRKCYEDFSVMKDTRLLTRAIRLYQDNIEIYPKKFPAIIAMYRVYLAANMLDEMRRYLEECLVDSEVGVDVRLEILALFVKKHSEEYKQEESPKLIGEILRRCKQWEALKMTDQQSLENYYNQYVNVILSERVRYALLNGDLKDAEESFAKISALKHFANLSEKREKELLELLQQARAQQMPKQSVTKAQEVLVKTPTPVTAHKIALQEHGTDAAVEAVPIVERVALEECPETGSWEDMELSVQTVIEDAFSIQGEHRLPYLLTYLKAAGLMHRPLQDVYDMVSLAVNNPLEEQNETATDLLNLTGMQPVQPALMPLCYSAACLRMLFTEDVAEEYRYAQLRDVISTFGETPALQQLVTLLFDYRAQTNFAFGNFTPRSDRASQNSAQALADIRAQAKELHYRLIEMPPRETASIKRLVIAQKILFAGDGTLANMLKMVMQNDAQALAKYKEVFVKDYILADKKIATKNIDAHKVSLLIDQMWAQAADNAKFAALKGSLMGNRRTNLAKRITSALAVVCDWYEHQEKVGDNSEQTNKARVAYLRLVDQVKLQMQRVLAHTQEMQKAIPAPAPENVGWFLLGHAVSELLAAIEDTAKEEDLKYLFAPFLQSDWVLLDENYLPDFSGLFCALSSFHLLTRIQNHMQGEKQTPQEHIDAIFSRDGQKQNFASAHLIADCQEALYPQEPVRLPEEFVIYTNAASTRAEDNLTVFNENYEYAYSCGQIMSEDISLINAKDVLEYWFKQSCQTKQFGFFNQLIAAYTQEIKNAANRYQIEQEKRLSAMVARGTPNLTQAQQDYIQQCIVRQNFIVAEDAMNRIRKGDFSTDIQKSESIQYLEAFWNDYSALFGRVKDAGRALSSFSLEYHTTAQKSQRKGREMLTCWPAGFGNSGNTAERMQHLLELLGWRNIVTAKSSETRIELYDVSSTTSRLSEYTVIHQIAAFGSDMVGRGFSVLSLYGYQSWEMIRQLLQDTKTGRKNKILLIDYAFNEPERRHIARKMKSMEEDIDGVVMIIDRVLIAHLATNYNEGNINRKLISIAMPFAYYQPYVPASSFVLPPEMFIGRTEELRQIKEPTGVNLIFGGRQLGKTALLKKAMLDLDGKHSTRAVMIDLNHCDVATAARRLSGELVGSGILEQGTETEDWEVLARNIANRLRVEGEDKLSYLLIMLDEADTLIDSCGKGDVHYMPLVALKGLQQSFANRFKFVLAGLHNVVRFNREIALGQNSVITHLPSMKITPFGREEGAALIEKPLGYLGFAMQDGSFISQILAQSNYFPGLIQLYCQKLIETLRTKEYAGYSERETPPYYITDSHIKKVLNDEEFREKVREKLEITLRLDQDQGNYFYHIALLIAWMADESNYPKEGGYTATDIREQAESFGIRSLATLSTEQVQTQLEYLCDLNMLCCTNGKRDTDPECMYEFALGQVKKLLGSMTEIETKLFKAGE